MAHRFGIGRRVSRRRQVILTGSVLLLAASLFAPSATMAVEPRPAAPSGPLHDGIFLSVCQPSHIAPDDPIVHPGMPGASHQHEFFGNVTTNADSTYRTLRTGGTTCRIAADTAAYWVPSLYADGDRVAPKSECLLPLRSRPRTNRGVPGGPQGDRRRR